MRHIDRSHWGPGPWDDEPDRVEWRRHRMPCLIQRNPLGVWCGYVGVPPSHPWHGLAYEEVDAHAHGGLTYAAPCYGDICHVAMPGEPDDVWWLGFDCAHALDFVPAWGQTLGAYLTGCVYRDKAYAMAEVERLADQAMRLRP